MKSQRPLRTAALVWLSLSTLYAPLSTALARPGDLDTSFALTGKLRLGFGGEPGFGSAVAAQGDGKLVIAGGTGLYGPPSEFAVVRFDTNTVLDASFGAEGRVRTNIGSQTNAFANALRIQADGKIVAAGYAYDGTNNQSVFALARYNPDGSLDTSFGNGGKLITDFAPGWPYPHSSAIRAMVIQNDGIIHPPNGDRFFRLKNS